MVCDGSRGKNLGKSRECSQGANKFDLSVASRATSSGSEHLLEQENLALAQTLRRGSQISRVHPCHHVVIMNRLTTECGSSPQAGTPTESLLRRGVRTALLTLKIKEPTQVTHTGDTCM